MLKLFGTPGAKSENCSPATGDFAKRIMTRIDVGPFKVSGLDIAVRSLKDVLAEAEMQIPQVVASVKNDGMLCVRHKRRNANSFSNHSWGTAIDLYFGQAAIPQGQKTTERGCLQLAPFFNKHGWYWAAGFSGASVDSMHFELAEEAILAAEKQTRTRTAAAPTAIHAIAVNATTFAGLDFAHVPGDAAMEKYQSAGFEVSCVYLSHSQAGKDSGWIAACPKLEKNGWGIAPIFFGAQLVAAGGHALPQPKDPLSEATNDSARAVKLAGNAGLDKGRTVFLDIETTFAKGSAYESYVLKWVEAVNQAGYKVGVYCQRLQSPWAASHGLPA
jgi:hypothetical protein